MYTQDEGAPVVAPGAAGNGSADSFLGHDWQANPTVGGAWAVYDGDWNVVATLAKAGTEDEAKLMAAAGQLARALDELLRFHHAAQDTVFVAVNARAALSRVTSAMSRPVTRVTGPCHAVTAGPAVATLTDAGFKLANQGGGCLAWERQVGARVVLISTPDEDDGGGEAGEGYSDPEAIQWLACAYNLDMDPLETSEGPLSAVIAWSAQQLAAPKAGPIARYVIEAISDDRDPTVYSAAMRLIVGRTDINPDIFAHKARAAERHDALIMASWGGALIDAHDRGEQAALYCHRTGRSTPPAELCRPTVRGPHSHVTEMCFLMRIIYDRAYNWTMVNAR